MGRVRRKDVKMVTYSKNGNLVTVHDEQGDVVYTKRSCEVTLENLRKNRAAFATDEAWQKQMDKYTNALAMFDAPSPTA